MKTDDKIHVLIVDDVAESRENLQTLLQFESDILVVGLAATGKEAIALAIEHEADVVVMDIGLPDMSGLEAAEAITHQVPATQLIMIADETESSLIRQAMLAGARDFLTKPLSSEELIVTIRRVFDRGQSVARRLSRMRKGAEDDPMSPMGLPEREGHILTIYSPKGGVGCTTVAVNLAVALAQMGKQTGLLDLNPFGGDAPLLLGMKDSTTISEFMNVNVLVDLAQQGCAQHSSGVFLFSSNIDVVEGKDPDEMKRFLEVTTRHFDYMIIDAPTNLHEYILAAFDASDSIISIGTPDVQSIRGIRHFLDVVEQLGYSRSFTTLIFNQTSKNGNITTKTAQDALKHPVLMSIPADDQLVSQASNQGIPLVSRESNKPVVAALRELAQHYVASSEPESVAKNGRGKKSRRRRKRK